MVIYEVLMAFLGNTVYSAGVILQKKGSIWMNWKEKKDGRYTAMLAIWAFGILFSNVLSAMPIGIASKKLPPQTISAMTGWNIAAVVLLSSLFLNERLKKKDAVYIFLITASIVIINICGKEMPSDLSRGTGLYILISAPFLFLVPVLLKLVKGKLKIGLLSAFSGTMGGLTLVLMNVLVRENGASLSALLSSQYLVLYFGVGIASLAAIQSAYRLGDVTLITPVQTSVSIIYPLICSYFLFDSGFNAAQLISLAVIVAACFGLLRKT